MPVSPPRMAIYASADGSYILTPEDADAQGSVHAQSDAVPNLGAWNNPKDSVNWTVHFNTPGSYSVTTKASAANGDTTFVVDAGMGASAPIVVVNSGGWDKYLGVSGVVKIASAGDHVVTVRPADVNAWKPMNLAAVILHRTGD